MHFWQIDTPGVHLIYFQGWTGVQFCGFLSICATYLITYYTMG